MKVFITSDNHFYHHNIIRYCNRPFKSVKEMNYVMVQNWNKTVAKEDIVFHLGDFALTSINNVKHIRKQLNGTIFLLPGNHDRKRILRNSGIIVVPSIIRFNNIVLTHRPLLEVRNGLVNVHGHIHEKNTYGKRINASVDVTGFTPVPIEKYIKEANKMLFKMTGV